MIDKKYVYNLIKKYAASPCGKKDIKDKTGIDYNPENDKSISQTSMLAQAEQMRTILWQHINRHIKSIAIDDIIIESPIVDENGKTLIFLSFRPGSMFRSSLDPEEYPEGIQNIALHFTHGWSAKRPIFGKWHGNEVWSRVTRGKSSFMQDAVKEFNSNVKCKSNAAADLSDNYK